MATINEDHLGSCEASNACLQATLKQSDIHNQKVFEVTIIKQLNCKEITCTKEEIGKYIGK